MCFHAVSTAIIVIVVFSVVRETRFRYYITQQNFDSEMSSKSVVFQYFDTLWCRFHFLDVCCCASSTIILKEHEISNAGHGDLIFWVSKTNIGLLVQWMNCLFLKRYLIAFSWINGIFFYSLRSFSEPTNENAYSHTYTKNSIFDPLTQGNPGESTECNSQRKKYFCRGCKAKTEKIFAIRREYYILFAILYYITVYTTCKKSA